jgi:RNA polymerase sigma-70 factor (ECF subfamily)
MTSNESFDHLMRGLRARQDSAATAVFQRYAHRLVALARTKLTGPMRQKIDAEDVLQSVFKSFFIRHADGQFDLNNWDSLWTLLTVITVRKCLNSRQHFRAARRNVARESAPAASAEDSRAGWDLLDREPTPDEATALADLVEQTMRSLDERGRQILTLRLQGCLVEDIAQQVGCAERTVRRVLDFVKSRLESLTRERIDSPRPAK